MGMRVAAFASVFIGLACTAVAHERVYVAELSGAAEFPVNNSAGTGFVVVTVDLDLLDMHVDVEFSGLEGVVQAAHIHAPTSMPLTGLADVASQVPSFAEFPSGVTSGSYAHSFNLGVASSYNPSFIASSGGTISQALNALLSSFDAGKAYLNIHTSSYGGGEIRGFLLPDPKADFDHDGHVDEHDFAMWAAAFGEDHEGDANDDELSNGADFLIWQEQFGSEAGIGEGGHGHATAAPEPGGAHLVAAAGVWMAGCFRRNPNRGVGG